jgi:hypothetical protein
MEIEKKRGDTKDHPLSQWFSNFSEADELLKLAAARQQVRLIASSCPYFLTCIKMVNILLVCLATFHAQAPALHSSFKGFMKLSCLFGEFFFLSFQFQLVNMSRQSCGI